MSSPLVAWTLRSELLAGALAVAALAALVAMTLLRGAAAAAPASRWRRLGSAGLALATGVWSGHFIMMSSAPLPGAAGYDGGLLVAAFGLTLALALAAHGLLGLPARPTRRVGAALLLGAGLCAMPWLALLALQREPAVAWDAGGLALAWLIGSLGTGAAIWLAPAPRQRRPGRLRPALAALLMGLSLVAVDAAVVCLAQWHAGGEALPAASVAGTVSAATVTLLGALAGPAVLVLLLLASALEGRFLRLLGRARAKLQKAAHTDPLTSLNNRLLFEERLQRAVHKADRHDQRLALLFVNLDGLKGVNESFGQGTGDALLRTIGQRLRAVNGADLLARAGGAEFLLLLEGNPDAAEASARASALLDEIARPCQVEQRELVVSCSIGIAMYPEHGALSRLIPHAAAALNAAKNMGGATYCFFEASMVAGKRDEVELLRDLRCAIEHGEFELFYQPKIHAPSGQITGAEALMRWHHPKRGMISPGVFIPIAEHYGLINSLGNWVIEDACRQIRAWRNQGLRMRVAINLSVHQLRQADLAPRIAAALQRNRLEPRLLTCEITESVAMGDSAETLSVIAQLAAIGVHLSIDDFGTGYSNLSCLRKLPAEELKIDRSFILDLETSGDARAIVDAVVKLAQAIGLKVVAEGVETERQQEILRQLGCDELQGFLFAKPMSARALAHWAMNHEGPRTLDFRASLFGETRAVELV